MESLRIAICDDEAVDLANTLAQIRDYAPSADFQCTCFSRAADILEQGEFDIVFLDIEMEPPSGYDVAKELVMKPHSPVIIFVTKSSAYTRKGYGLALRYLTKPLDTMELSEAMDAAIREATANRMTLDVEGVLHTFVLHDIYFIEVLRHYILIHEASKTYQGRGALKDIYYRLPQGYFAMPHQSYIVNMEHIRSVSGNEISMVNGSVIPISRRKQNEFNSRFFRYLGR